jgi:hypothetical protein
MTHKARQDDKTVIAIAIASLRFMRGRFEIIVNKQIYRGFGLPVQISGVNAAET